MHDISDQLLLIFLSSINPLQYPQAASIHHTAFQTQGMFCSCNFSHSLIFFLVFPSLISSVWLHMVDVATHISF